MPTYANGVSETVAVIPQQLAAHKVMLGQIANDLDALTGVRAGLVFRPTITLVHPWADRYDRAKFTVDEQRGVALTMWSSRPAKGSVRLYADDLRGEPADRLAARDPGPLKHAVELLARLEREHIQS